MNRFLVLIIFFAFLTACRNEDQPKGDGTVSFKINGRLVKNEYNQPIFSTSPYNKGAFFYRVNNGTDYQIEAHNNAGTRILIFIKNISRSTINFKNGDGRTYGSAPQDTSASIEYDGETYVTKEGRSGNITVSNFSSTEVEGNFEMIMYSLKDKTKTITITKGYFND